MTAIRYLAAGAAALAMAVVAPAALVLVVADSSAASPPSGGGELNSSAIPAAAQRWIPYLEQAGTLCPQVTAPLLAAQITQESDWNPNAVSPTGAEGLSQFEPATWPTWSHPAAIPGRDTPWRPPDAIMAEGRFMCALVADLSPLSTQTGVSVVSLALAAYNAGVDAVVAAGGIPAIAQTQDYVRAILDNEASFQVFTLVSTSGPLASLWPKIEAAAEIQVADQTPYLYGGDQPDVALDCSAYVQWTMAQVGLKLPRTSQLQWSATVATAVPFADATPGMLLFFGPASGPTHVTIYAGKVNGIPMQFEEQQTGTVAQLDAVWATPTSDVATMP